VNVNLCAFKEIVDSVGGVKIPFSYRTKDERVGFREVGPGCVELRGSQALAYVRSRSGYKFFDETKQKWVGDPTGDIGRINRQQDFLRRSMQRALDRGTTNPATANALLNVALQRVITDDRITPRDLLQLAQAMRNLDTTGVNSYTVEWSMRRIGGESVLIPVLDTESMRVILSVFRGQAVVGQTSSNDGTNSQDAGAASSFVAIERTADISTVQLATFLLAQLVNNDDSTSTTIPVVSPKQQRLGVFPPDDPTCR
jgi:anionic cell wall polymer biosynthesis LytR-Cps2A-Psr (LCP) family protein